MNNSKDNCKKYTNRKSKRSRSSMSSSKCNNNKKNNRSSSMKCSKRKEMIVLDSSMELVPLQWLSFEH